VREFCGNELQELLEFWELAKFVVAKSQIFIKELLEFRELAKFVGRCKISHEVSHNLINSHQLSSTLINSHKLS
jgi:hypothetical protein